MTRTLLILSGQYVSPTMQSELGSVPPAFLSLAGTILLEHQARAIDEAGGADVKLLTLPESLVPNNWQQRKLDELGFQVIPSPERFGIGEAILYALTVSGQSAGGLRLLYGDTLIDGLDMNDEDLVVVDAPPDAGHWAVYEPDGAGGRLVSRFVDRDEAKVMAGYASFSSIPELMRATALEGYHFISALMCYATHRPLRFETRGRWYDFGRPRTYFDSRRDFTTERHFNALTIDRGIVTKTSAQTEKMRAEGDWFECVPSSLRFYTPALVGTLGKNAEHEQGYSLEYLQMLPLSDCFAFLDLPRHSWGDAIHSLARFLAECRAYKGDPLTDPAELYARKTYDRLAQFSAQTGIDPKRVWTLNGTDVGSFDDVVARALDRIGPTSRTCIMHGDLCFSNILFDTRTGRIRVIDPRGGVDVRRPSIYGDQRYDLAKLYHSYAGFYDLILAGRATLHEHEPYTVDFSIEVSPEQLAVSEAFDVAMRHYDLADPATIRAIAVLLFVSMTPLHVDKPLRQMQLALNALRLGSEL